MAGFGPVDGSSNLPRATNYASCLYLCCTLTRQRLLNRNTLVFLSIAKGDSSVVAQNLQQDEDIEKLNQLIDRLLNRILGQEATQIIYRHLESNHSIRRHEIAQKLDSFNEALEQYLGSGAFVIEKAILENLEENRDIDFERHKILKLA